MYLQFRWPNIFKWGKYIFLIVFGSDLSAQTSFKLNVLADIEFSKAGSESHYYYNEIDQDHIDSRLGIAQFNFIGQVKLASLWTFNTRLLLERDKGRKLEKFAIPQLNIEWHSKKRKIGFTLGSFTNPFGSYNQKQLSTDRNLIGLPLAYAYYVNISDKIGFTEGLGDIAKIPIDGAVEWGVTNIYYGGYTTGAQFSWNIKPSKVNWKIALVNGASNLQKQITDPINIGVVSKLKVQPTYFWEQGISVSHGTFLLKSEVSDQLENLKAFTQTTVGVDFKMGSGFLEFSGELIGSSFTVPTFSSENGTFEIGASQKLNSVAGYLDLKYEPPVLQGSFVAYRIDHMRFSELDNSLDQSWDNNVLRHSMAIGYHINKYVLTRIGVSSQHVDRKSKWDKNQRTFRVVLTAHY